MKRLVTALTVFALLLLAQPNIAAYARGGGMGMHPHHFSGHFGKSHHHRNFARNNQNLWWYGGYGYYAIPSSYTSGNGDVTGTVPATVMYVPIQVQSCRKVQEAMTVPSEEGGTRQVTVTRCQGS